MTATALIPDLHHYHGRGGRAYPLWQDAAATIPNINPALLDHLSIHYGTAIAPADVVAYIVAITAHPAYTTTFAADLETPGLRIPWTADPELFSRATQLGKHLLWSDLRRH